MVIKPFKSQPKLPANYEQETWEKLETALRAVNSKVATHISKEELYRAVEDLCIHKFGGMVYENLQKECESHIFRQVDSLCEQMQLSDHGAFLAHVDRVWQEHCEQMNTVRNIFLYLDRSYALQTPGVRSLWDLGLDLFRKRLGQRHEVQHKVVVGLLAAVESERHGIAIDREVLRRLLRMLVALGLYGENFEVPFLADSRRFFKTEGQVMAQSALGDGGGSGSGVVGVGAASSSGGSGGVGDSGRGLSGADSGSGFGVDPAGFLLHVERRLVEAQDMVTRYLDASTKAPLLQVRTMRPVQSDSGDRDTQ
jgi:cullin-4